MFQAAEQQQKQEPKVISERGSRLAAVAGQLPIDSTTPQSHHDHSHSHGPAAATATTAVAAATAVAVAVIKIHDVSLF